MVRIDLVSPDRRHTSLLTVRPRAGAELHDGVEPGDRVEVAVGSLKLSGEVVDADTGWAEIRVQGEVELQGEAVVTRTFDPTPWRRLAEALDKADAHRSPLRDVLLGKKPASPLLSTTPRLDPTGLDETQREAASIVLRSGEVALVHGPPGSGKTTLLVALLRAAVADGDRPWALADSNAAVDHVAGRAAAAGLDVVRVGPPGRMGEEGRRLSLKERIRTGPFAAALARLERDILRLDPHQDRDALADLQLQARELREQAEDAALQSAQVIASTLGTLLRRAAHLPPPRHAFVDEATQAIEPAVWAAVPHIQHLTLVGDPRQLGPVVTRPNSPLEVSLVERLLGPAGPGEGRKLPMPMLAIQRRMHQSIQDLVADQYPETWRAADEVRGHLVAHLPGVLPTSLTERPTLFVDTAGADLGDEIDPATRSWRNPGEARLIALVVAALRDARVHPSLIGVITPYSAQTRLIAHQPELEGVEVASINSFQGREREIILVSWVRSNADGQIGFVADGRRLTVALSRARRLLVQVGDSGTLASHPRFARLFDVLAQQEAVDSVWNPPWDQVVAG
jgi:energy-coupling factor transporter ATP-binding protein EcfA2